MEDLTKCCIDLSKCSEEDPDTLNVVEYPDNGAHSFTEALNPWSFCETPEGKCTMNYCDDNGCQNRKRVLVSEEIPDPTAQLQADKAELLELMAEMKESFDHKAWVTEMELKSFSSRIESLIQKHKQ